MVLEMGAVGLEAPLKATRDRTELAATSVIGSRTIGEETRTVRHPKGVAAMTPTTTARARLAPLATGMVSIALLLAPGPVPAADAPPTAATPARTPTPTDLLFELAQGSRFPLPIPLPGLSRKMPSDPAAPGQPPRGGRPRPGSMFDPGAAGPGISQSGNENFLDGALDPRTGWPFVWLDHFRPRPERMEQFWVVSTRDCPQVMGSDPWPRLVVKHFDDEGRLVPVDPGGLMAQADHRPVFIQVQGSLTTPDIALGGLMWTQSWLDKERCLPPDAVVVAFDWPSQRVYSSDVRDINEKGRRAFIAGYHLARFVASFPPGSRIGILGQSYGGRVVPSALHLLGGGALNSQDHDADVRLPACRPDLHVRAVIIAGASDRTWLDPGQRLDHALLGCEAFLNLYNRRDESLRLYPFLVRSDHHRALGRIGLSNRDLERLGPLAARYAEHDVHDILGSEHTLLDAVANRQIARRIASYAFAADPGPSPPRPESELLNYEPNRFRLFSVARPARR